MVHPLQFLFGLCRNIEQKRFRCIFHLHVWRRSNLYSIVIVFFFLLLVQYKDRLDRSKRRRPRTNKDIVNETSVKVAELEITSGQKYHARLTLQLFQWWFDQIWTKVKHTNKKIRRFIDKLIDAIVWTMWLPKHSSLQLRAMQFALALHGSRFSFVDFVRCTFF